MSAGANIHYSNEGQNALDLALSHEHPAVVDYLASLGAKPSLKVRNATAAIIPNQEAEQDVRGSITDEEDNMKKSDRWKETKTWAKQNRRESDNAKLEGNRKVELDDFNGALESYIHGLKNCYPCKDSRSLRATLHSNCSFVLLELKQSDKALDHARKVSRPWFSSWAHPTHNNVFLSGLGHKIGSDMV